MTGVNQQPALSNIEKQTDIWREEKRKQNNTEREGVGVLVFT